MTEMGHEGRGGVMRVKDSTQVIIMAVPWEPKRAKRAVTLAKQVAPEGHESRGFTGRIVWDEEHDAFDTWRRALATAGEDPAIFLEDDVVLAPGWREKAEYVIGQRPDTVIQFFSMRPSDQQAGSGMRPGRGYLMNQCHYLPAGVAAEVHRFSEGWPERNPALRTGTDSCLASYLATKKERYWMNLPSIVQHEKWTSEINPRRPKNRVSRSFEESFGSES